MATKKEKPKFYETIQSICRQMEQARKDYAWNCEELARMDQLTQDLLHKLELDGLDFRGRAKVATQLTKCRQNRRQCKNVVEVLEPLVLFLESDKGRQMMNLLREAQGRTRRIEERMDVRTYHPKYIPPEIKEKSPETLLKEANLQE